MSIRVNLLVSSPGDVCRARTQMQLTSVFAAANEGDATRQFAIMSVRVRGLVPTFPDGSQAVVGNLQVVVAVFAYQLLLPKYGCRLRALTP